MKIYGVLVEVPQSELDSVIPELKVYAEVNELNLRVGTTQRRPTESQPKMCRTIVRLIHPYVLESLGEPWTTKEQAYAQAQHLENHLQDKDMIGSVLITDTPLGNRVK